MHIDASTVLLFGLLLKVPLALLFLIFFLIGARASCFAWWSATFAFGSLTSVVLLAGGIREQLFGIGLAMASLVAGIACCWQGARAFERRRPLWLPVLAAPGLWLAACLVPGFLQTAPYRVALSSCLLAPMLAMTAVELWRGRQERLPSRLAVIAVFASLALLFTLRIPLIPVAPFPFGAVPAAPVWLAAFNLVMFFHTVLLAVLLVAMSKERLELAQRNQAQTDPLTGALNRRAFMTTGGRVVLRHQKTHEPLCLVFVDLDHFKSLNDRYGHSGGDEVLIKFVTIVHANIRSTDFLFRMGGEEFCCLLPHTGVQEALGVAERIRRNLEAARVEVAGTSTKVTVSVGVASTETFGYDVDALVHRADMAVYAAKRQGRNKVVVAVFDQPVDLGESIPMIREKLLAAS